ncbi:MAG TPA: Asp-tRNA(Asn)/Glu-tRNA(Gln) amidotransferase subunit GatC [Candidatus Paceibacterota bacterium]|nr:Asp-tRNA(Asn)/Glu-tRNA(Gln) amidotransferase subunit GatC [Candidatus Paceibacterota bacterium]
MISREDIVKLAGLSRLKLSEDEIVRMQGEMTSILAYVDKLKTASGAGTDPVISANKNVMREDADPHHSGEFTDKLIALAPKHETTKEGKFVKVKKILGGSQ